MLDGVKLTITKKELISVTDGVRKSKLIWKDILIDLKKRGLRLGTKLAIGDGALGFWAALREVYPLTKEQLCWVHKTANILDKLPKGIQEKAKSGIHEMYMAETKESAMTAYDHFVNVYGNKYPKAIESLAKNKDKLFTFYEFPAKQWIHIRTTNPIESTFATIRLRTKKTKSCGTRKTTLTMLFKLGIEAEKRWTKLKGHDYLPLLFENNKFINGVLEEEIAA